MLMVARGIARNSEGEFEAKTTMDRTPEGGELRFYTTGLQGGDSGHGGEAWVEFKFDGGDHRVMVFGNDDPDAVIIDDIHRVRIVAYGDWELDGLARGLCELGLKLWTLIHERDEQEKEHAREIVIARWEQQKSAKKP